MAPEIQGSAKPLSQADDMRIAPDLSCAPMGTRRARMHVRHESGGTLWLQAISVHAVAAAGTDGRPACGRTMPSGAL